MGPKWVSNGVWYKDVKQQILRILWVATWGLHCSDMSGGCLIRLGSGVLGPFTSLPDSLSWSSNVSVGDVKVTSRTLYFNETMTFTLSVGLLYTTQLITSHVCLIRLN